MFYINQSILVYFSTIGMSRNWSANELKKKSFYLIFYRCSIKNRIEMDDIKFTNTDEQLSFFYHCDIFFLVFPDKKQR